MLRYILVLVGYQQHADSKQLYESRAEFSCAARESSQLDENLYTLDAQARKYVLTNSN